MLSWSGHPRHRSHLFWSIHLHCNVDISHTQHIILQSRPIKTRHHCVMYKCQMLSKFNWTRLYDHYSLPGTSGMSEHQMETISAALNMILSVTPCNKIFETPCITDSVLQIIILDTIPIHHKCYKSLFGTPCISNTEFTVINHYLGHHVPS